MNTPVIIPSDLWDEDDETSAILTWLFPDGAAVQKGSIIAEVLVEKVTLELAAPATGRLRIAAEPEAVVMRGGTVAMIEAEQQDGAAQC